MNISGKVPTDTTSVSVNDYTLKEFTLGSPRFSYAVSLTDGTLKEGKNTYTVVFNTGTGVKITEDTMDIYYSKDALA